ncbi:MAG: hypothetical protein EZS28_009453 [Streblomastix strix]|uniref:Uncharacterized protein n=1 Tax=Streblomastix strix TaxID=222440 RepID=A0A5J4WJB9_9EUKA|nr:MAG: hypothetical protein EZS28_009453 [Streblomastix strix]
MEKSGEQGNTSEVEESNLFQWERGIGRVNGSINKGRIRIRNNQSDQLRRNTIVEQNIRNQEVGKRIEENNGLLTVEHTIEIPTFYNERFEQDTGNMEERRLGIPDRHQIGVQSCGSNWRVGEMPDLYAQGDALYTSGIAFRNFNSTENICKDNFNNNRQSEKQESSSNIKLHRRHSVPDQCCENNGLDKRNDSNEEVFDRAVLVDEQVREQQTKDDRQEIKSDNNSDGRVNFGMESERDQKQHKDQEDIRIMGSGYGEFKLARDISDIQSSISAERIYQPIGIQLNKDRIRQYNSMFFNNKNKGKISFDESRRFDFINRGGKWMDISNKTYRCEIEQRSGHVIKAVNGTRLINKERCIRGCFEGLVSRNNSGFIRSKKQCQTQEILYVGEGQKSEKMRLDKSHLGEGARINTPTDTNNSQGNKENNRGESLRNNDSTMLARVSLVDTAKGNNSEREGVGRE